jgi:hypothetical protein
VSIKGGTIMKKLLLLSLLVASNAQAINIQNFQFSLDPKYTITEGAFVVDERVADYKLLFNSSYNYTNDPILLILVPVTR